ncbi:LysR family transcriptional regulator [uncultured Zoogloea sp.]|uniref:LysR family transcriptional regulator n=1 Tax=uncultured Zoogloea sp. TaxID=160237 RepID=UPI002608A55A|nr:LysR family transcriptional regulator [uncultured Zoogloea sp.]
MLHLPDVQLFIRVAELGNISAAGRALNMSPAAASAAIKRLEQRVDSQLIERSTRSLRLTQAGETFLAYCQQSQLALEEGLSALRQGREQLSGDIHLGAPSDLGRDRLDTLLEPFRQRHPQVRLVMHLSDGLIDLYRNPIDLVLRYGLSEDSGLVGRKLCDNGRVLVASPDYLARHGHPESFEALARRNCICFYRNGELFNRWRLFHGGQHREIVVTGDRAADDGALVRQWAVAGHGIAYKSRIDVQADLDAGRLVDLFPDAIYDRTPLYVAYPSRRYQPARIKALLDWLEVGFGGG